MDLSSMIEQHQQPLGFAYSAVSLDQLDSTEYTLVQVVMDVSGSVSPYANDLLKLKATVIDACNRSPRADYMLIRMVEFNQNLTEVHPFLPLPTIDTTRYTLPNTSGSTALYDATFSAIHAANDYAKKLADKRYLVNAITFVITDGDDNASSSTCNQIKQEIQQAISGEVLESNRTVLIGVNPRKDPRLTSYLERFAKDVGFDQFEDMNDASPASLAKLAQFVSRSISSQSQALGTGGPSQLLSF